MQTALRLETTVVPGHRLEMTALELPDGAKVEVISYCPNSRNRTAFMLDLVESLPPGPRAFKTWEEYEQHLREEKAAWER